jgi:hypothetical protein
LQLSKQYKCSIKTIQRRLDKVTIRHEQKSQNKHVVLLMDTTYFRRRFGVMLFKDAHTGINLYKQYVLYETNQLYAQGVNHLREKGFIIQAAVCDGRRGLFHLLGDIPVQMCQFHQVAIVTRYLTRNPKLDAGRELRKLTMMLAKTDKASFVGGLEEWYGKWHSFLNERSINIETGKTRYTHKNLRSAYRSLKTNLPWLFTWYDNPDINIPNTTNAIDGHFADMKTKLRNHNGLTDVRKKRFIDEFLKV